MLSEDNLCLFHHKSYYGNIFFYFLENFINGLMLSKSEHFVIHFQKGELTLINFVDCNIFLFFPFLIMHVYNVSLHRNLSDVHRKYLINLMDIQGDGKIAVLEYDLSFQKKNVLSQE